MKILICTVACWTLTVMHATNPLAMLGTEGIAAMGQISSMASISYVPNQNPLMQLAMQSMGNLPTPMVAPIELINPNLLSEEGACERDYNAKCPVGFVVVGDIFGDGERCGADKSIYSGPCEDRTIKFIRLTKRAKQHWALLCNFQWPCQHCEKDFSGGCPQGWKPPPDSPVGTSECLANEVYQGPCEGRKDFTGYNAVTKEIWSQTCQAYWPCKNR